MFFALLFVVLLISLLVCFLVARAFDKPITTILERIVGEEIASVWAKYMKFAIYVVGISGGVRIYELERYLPHPNGYTPDGIPIPSDSLTLTPEYWILEVYRTVIETLQALAWMLLLFFLFAMIAYIIIRIWGDHKGKTKIREKPQE
ncbi:MAG: hypothetical protein GXN93_01195 [Candidatus Diapherotrites archaeon]|nr:hypothetical protein [Candidatus Diapherotrites archaeon]